MLFATVNNMRIVSYRSLFCNVDNFLSVSWLSIWVQGCQFAIMGAMTKKRDTLTLKQKKLVAGISDNLSGKNSLPFTEIAQKAGYTKESSRNPNEILKSKALKKELSIVLASIDRAKALHLAQLERPEKVENISARDNAYITDILIKNQRLLTGESTENKAISIVISESLASKYDENQRNP